MRCDISTSECYLVAFPFIAAFSVVVSAVVVFAVVVFAVSPGAQPA